MARTSNKREEILQFLTKFVAENGYAPSVREICQAVGLQSTATVHYHLNALRDAGLISMKKFFAEFKEFISRGNVMDMAIGVILATAFGKITTSLVNDVFLPFLGWLIGDIDLAALNIQLSPAVVQNGEVVKEAVVLGLGTFISAVLDFILIAFIVFSIVKALNAAKRKLEKPAEPAAPAAPEPSNEEKLLTEIRDLLKNQK